ncbi:TetR/AcrR family transcriptional regulator [Streptomonospora litoralis]|uniref:Transcriptional regulator, TetR family n=1 Tax=Streptomonospora litoralis TaxID=2498135 RepID=A0A4P6Q6F6_9ACTN|nr:TetR/AcrR family transcriptional regulator [Streptomonospora litoralis]QBI56305.1 Transcriptional regulator, TetR family [Streptomonospora litoralis]
MSDRKRTSASGGSSPARRRRGAELEGAIYAAALDETAEVGLARVTMEGIARRAGTAKTSLYRRWTSPEDIVLGALYREYPVERPSPGADDLRGDLVAALTLMRDGLMQRRFGMALRSVVDEAERRPELHKRLYEEVFDARGGRFTRTVLQHYADHGHIDPARLTPVVVDIGEALLLKYGIDAHAKPDDAYIEAVVDEAILPAVGCTVDGAGDRRVRNRGA